MAKVADMLPPDGREMARAIERLLGEPLSIVEKERSLQLFAATVPTDQLLAAWEHLSSKDRAAYKYWTSRHVTK